FEITETAAISHLEDAKKFIRTLQSLGAKFALDDFGSGLSSFGYLKTLPVDFLKIDGGLIKNLVREPSDLSIVKCVNDVAHMLGMQTIAEFVEDQQTLESLKSLGIDYVQGYGIEKPKSLKGPSPRDAEIHASR
nr:EAL domain-containing protein [Leptolyngbyaceae cyanobacterium MAG.088]